MLDLTNLIEDKISLVNDPLFAERLLENIDVNH